MTPDKLDRARSADERNAAAYVAALARVTEASRAVGRLRAETAAAGPIQAALMAMPTAALEALTVTDLQALYVSSPEVRARLLRREAGAPRTTGADAEAAVAARLSHTVDSGMRAISRVLSAERNLADARTEAALGAARRAESARHLQALTHASRYHRAAT